MVEYMSFAPPKIGPWGWSDAFIFFCEITVFYIAYSRESEILDNRIADANLQISENVTMPVLKDDIHIDALGIISRTFLQHNTHVLQITEYILIARLNMPNVA